MKRPLDRVCGISLCIWFASLLAGFAGDWPTYMHDPARSGVSDEALPLPLSEMWTYTPPAEPTRAWPDPQPAEWPKLDFDDATHVAMAGDAVYFGSPVDNGVHALDAADGAWRWTVFTEGPVRLAPTVADGRVFAGSDDGAVYCIEAKDGGVVWRTRPMPGATRIIGAGRMMSLWPIRTGVLVDGGVAYCGAGIFPALGTTVVALDAASGKQVWKAPDVPKRSGVTLAPQGYLLASAEQIYAPCGRTAPLTYARADGVLRGAMEASYDIVAGKGLVSGCYGVLVADRLYIGTQNVLHGYRPDGKHVDSWTSSRRLAATSNRYYRLAGRDIVSAIDRAAFDTAGHKNPVPKAMVQWSYRGSNLQSIIVSGTHVMVGGSNEVVALDAATGKEVWKGKTDGLAKGLAVANGRLVVSTDKGRLHCFGDCSQTSATAEPATRTLLKVCAWTGPARETAKPAAEPFPKDTNTAWIAALSDSIAKDAKLDRGYGLVIGGDGARPFDSALGLRLAYELAKRTGMLIHAIETDPAKAAAAREALSAAGAYGTKVVVDVMQPDGTNGLPYPPYFANLIVVAAGTLSNGTVPDRDILRVLKPCGGALYAQIKTPDAAWAEAGIVTEVKLAGSESWTKLVRGRLPGAGDWTHQYADAGNTGSSDDDLVRGKPTAIWYGEPGPNKMQERHRRSEAPLLLDGRVFAQGLRVAENTPLLMSFDAYNGMPYWDRELPGAERIYITGDCGNLAVSSQGLFVAVGNQCTRLDLLTGETRSTYTTPARADGSDGKWAYVAVAGDTLVGSSYSGYQFSDAVFACDIKTGQLKWRYEGAVIRNATLAVQGGKVFFVEHRGQAKTPIVLDPLAQARAAEARRRGAAAAAKKAGAQDDENADGDSHGVDEPAPAKSVPVGRRDALGNLIQDTNDIGTVQSATKPYLRAIVALDLATGKQAWAREVDLTGCGGWTGNLCLIAKHDVILLCGIYSAYGRAKGDEDKRRAMALSAKDGAPIWDRAIGSYVRPVVVGDRIIGRPKAFSLLTGEPVMRIGKNGVPITWTISRGGACGQMSASARMLFYRHGQTMMMDAGTGGTLMAFIGMRPGCLINVIPAGGVIVQVESSSGCSCYHALQATVAFAPPGVEM